MRQFARIAVLFLVLALVLTGCAGTDLSETLFPSRQAADGVATPAPAATVRPAQTPAPTPVAQAPAPAATPGQQLNGANGTPPPANGGKDGVQTQPGNVPDLGLCTKHGDETGNAFNQAAGEVYVDSPVGGLNESCGIVGQYWGRQNGRPIRVVVFSPPGMVVWYHRILGGTFWMFDAQGEDFQRNLRDQAGELVQRDGSMETVIVDLSQPSVVEDVRNSRMVTFISGIQTRQGWVFDRRVKSDQTTSTFSGGMYSGSSAPSGAGSQAAPSGSQYPTPTTKPAASSQSQPGQQPSVGQDQVNAGVCNVAGQSIGPVILEGTKDGKPTVVKVNSGNRYSLGNGGCTSRPSQGDLDSVWEAWKGDFLKKYPNGQALVN